MSQKQFLKKKTKRVKNIKEEEESVIIGIIKVKKDNLKLKIMNPLYKVYEDYAYGEIGNEKKIKMCEIFINDKKIDFNYYYKFEKEGNYKIKYIFKKLLNSTKYMFYDCNSLISLDLSNFNTQNVTNMEFIFYNCINISRFIKF